MKILEKYSYQIAFVTGLLIFALIIQGKNTPLAVTLPLIGLVVWIIFKELKGLAKALTLVAITILISSAWFTLLSASGLNGARAFLVVSCCSSVSITLTYFYETFKSRWDSAILSLIIATLVSSTVTIALQNHSYTNILFVAAFSTVFFIKHYLPEILNRRRLNPVDSFNDEDFIRSVAGKVESLGWDVSIFRKKIPVLVATKGAETLTLVSYDGDFSSSNYNNENSLKAIFQETFRKLPEATHAIVSKKSPKNKWGEVLLPVPDSKKSLTIVLTGNGNYRFLG